MGTECLKRYTASLTDFIPTCVFASSTLFSTDAGRPVNLRKTNLIIAARPKSLESIQSLRARLARALKEMELVSNFLIYNFLNILKL